jgi:hypothetical protein
VFIVGLMTVNECDLGLADDYLGFWSLFYCSEMFGIRLIEAIVNEIHPFRLF